MTTVPAGADNEKLNMKKPFFRTPKFYIWTVLALLPLQAVLAAYIRNIDTAKGLAMYQKRADLIESAMRTGDTLSYILYGLIAVSVVFLLAASKATPKAA
jgi:hypothetical protein